MSSRHDLGGRTGDHTDRGSPSGLASGSDGTSWHALSTDIIAADGRLLRAATLEVAESALTGESLPVAMGTEPVDGADTPLGDRTDMVYMNTNLTSSPQ